MKRRIKTAMPPAGNISLIFSCIGAMFMLVGILCLCFPQDGDDRKVGIIFSVLGIAFLLTALTVLLVLIGQAQKKRRAITGGKYIYGEVVDVVPNFCWNYNCRPTFTVLTRHIDHKGVIHIFRSPNLKTYPDRSILGRKVKIYYQDDSFKQYEVDLDSGFPKVIEH